MSKESAFFALYPALENLLECVSDVSEYLRNATIQFASIEETETAVSRLESSLNDDRIRALGESAVTAVVQGLEEAKTWLAASRHARAPDDEQRPNLTERGIASLEAGWDSLRDLTDGLTRRAFGYWGAEFFSLCRASGVDLLSLYLPHYENDGLADLEELLNAPDLDMPSSGTARPHLVLTPLQKSILNALDGKALKKEHLAAKVCGGLDNGRILYRAGGINELRKHGFVDHMPTVGYYRPDSPPPGTESLLGRQ